ncbi:MAG: methyltransferase domain-containing protein [Acidobacteria bacterium]|nr:methyltransferase domain-containing protein [Acidobacteriota bacterium]MBU4307395.1 methyltransferase domain-containing protein [Acidobacteriota bacterium]MBU4404647.1 methyltransferase domain-containing protein [Acidobacteriota bacterium]MCG2811614.1 methyltransferase domain-containing protein [Candidatus Aminicenantes bacterium]
MNFISPAASVLCDYFTDPQTNLRLLLTRFLEHYSGSDKNALTRTVYGVVRKDIVLEHVIGLFLKNKNQAPATATHVFLKIAVFLLLYSDSYPEYAVVNEVVNAVAKKEKPFVNAVLRQLLRRKQEVIKSVSSSENPGLKFSISARLLASLQQVSAATEADLEYLDREPAFHLRFNPKQMTMDQARQALNTVGIPYRELQQLDCFETTAAGQVLENPEQLGGFYIQNSGSQAVALLAAATAEKTVCDVAAAPGGKSLTLACLRPDVKIWASDISPQRLRLLEQNIRRLHLNTIFPFVADIFKYPQGREAADLVILDAPCTSSGTLRKNPDLKSKISKEMIEKNARQQRLMLASLVERFPHARWLYAVCSFIHEESEAVVEKVAASRGLQAVAIQPLLEKYHYRVKKTKFGCYLLPSELNNDLFYISLIERDSK